MILRIIKHTAIISSRGVCDAPEKKGNSKPIENGYREIRQPNTSPLQKVNKSPPFNKRYDP